MGANMEEEYGCKWKEMNTDCLVCIFQKLSIEDMTLSVPFVCKPWRKATQDPLCWRVLDFRNLHFIPGGVFARNVTNQFQLSSFSFSAFLKFAVRRSCGSVVELRFPQMFQFSIHDMIYATDECPKVSILDIRDLWLKEDVHLPKVVGKWKELELLEMESKPSSFIDLVAEISVNCSKFTGLGMTGRIMKEDVSAIMNYLPKLKYLNLSRSYVHKTELLAIVDGCKELETLSVNFCRGFRADDGEILARACRIKTFERYGSTDQIRRRRMPWSIWDW